MNLRDLMFRIPLSAWMLILVVVALSGYAVFGLKYYAIQNEHGTLLRNNSTHIELEQEVLTIKAAYRVAVSAAQFGIGDDVRAGSKEFVDALITTAASNKVAALNERFDKLLMGAAKVEAILSEPRIDRTELVDSLRRSARDLNSSF